MTYIHHQWSPSAVINSCGAALKNLSTQFAVPDIILNGRNTVTKRQEVNGSRNRWYKVNSKSTLVAFRCKTEAPQNRPHSAWLKVKRSAAGSTLIEGSVSSAAIEGNATFKPDRLLARETCRSEHSGRIHIFGMGFTGFIWGARLPRNEEVVWH
jgi:hypothetical protein